MTNSIARVETERASIYLQQLCKHFAHKIPVTFTPEQGQITFSAGICRLEASDGILVQLSLHLEAGRLDDRHPARQLIGDHARGRLRS
jgi:hypothetical protein